MARGSSISSAVGALGEGGPDQQRQQQQAEHQRPETAQRGAGWGAPLLGRKQGPIGLGGSLLELGSGLQRTDW